MNTIEILVPTARTRTDERPPAARMRGLAGARIGWLDNRKANAAALLAHLAEELRTQGHRFETTLAAKDPTAAAPDTVMAHLESCDAVVLAIAD